MKRLSLLFFVVSLALSGVRAQNCDELFPGFNLHPDWQLTSLSNFVGWGGPKTLIDAATDPAHVYCGNTSIAVGSIGGGNCAGSLDVVIPGGLKANTWYRMRAVVWVNSGRFNIGAVNKGAILGTSKTQAWEQLDGYFRSGTNTGNLYFNNCDGYNGDMGYIDNWELYEWANLIDVQMLQALCTTANSGYDAAKQGAAGLRTALDAAETLLANLAPDKAPDVGGVAEDLKLAMANYLEPYVSSPMDYTCVVRNPTFELSLDGWASTTGAQNNQLQTNANQSIPDGTGKFWENWNGSSYSGKMSQTITNLPNGNYTLKAAAFRSSGEVYLFANAQETPVTTGSLTYHSINCTVTNHTLEIGLDIKSATWVGIDNVSLTYNGNAANALIGLVQVAIDNYVGKPMSATVAAELDAAIADANAAILSQIQADIDAATARLSAANAAAAQSIAAYATLKNAIDAANSNKADYAAYSGYAAYVEAILAVEENYANGAYSDAEIQEAINALKAAEIACRLTNPNTPADFTFAIWNPSFEDGNSGNLVTWGNVYAPNSWTFDYSGLGGWRDVTLINDANRAADGSYFFNVYSDVTTMNLSQEIRLPKGKYTLEAVMRTDNSSRIADQQIYAQAGDVVLGKDFLTGVTSGVAWDSKEAWIPLSVDFSLADEGLVKVGAAVNSTANGFFQLDNFKLTRTDSNDGTGICKAIQNKKFSATGIKGGVIANTSVSAEVKVYSILGQVVKSMNIAAGKTFISLAPGMYIINGEKVIVQ